MVCSTAPVWSIVSQWLCMCSQPSVASTRSTLPVPNGSAITLARLCVPRKRQPVAPEAKAPLEINCVAPCVTLTSSIITEPALSRPKTNSFHCTGSLAIAGVAVAVNE